MNFPYKTRKDQRAELLYIARTIGKTFLLSQLNPSSYDIYNHMTFVNHMTLVISDRLRPIDITPHVLSNVDGRCSFYKCLKKLK